MSLSKLTLAMGMVVLFCFILFALYIESDPKRSTPSEPVDVPLFIGAAATAKPVAEALAQPIIQHPYLAASGVNSMHNDSAQSDSYRWAGPLGNKLEVSTSQFHRITGSCVSQTFDQKGRMLGTCVTPFGVTLVARNPDTLELLARQTITRWLPIGQKFSGGVYFHLDHEDHVLLATNDFEIQRWALVGESENLAWQLKESISIESILNSARHEAHLIIDVMPDWQGNYWFITRAGIVGMVDRLGKSGSAIALRDSNTDEGIDNALAVGKNGVYIVSNHAMYSFMRGSSGEIVQQWRERYDRGSAPKLGTMGHGSGTTPTLIGEDYVAITDSADGQVHVVVYAQQLRSGSQQVCKQGVFPIGKGTSENSLAVVGNAVIVENNFGYDGPKTIPQAEPGIARVNILGASQGCELAWENSAVSSPSAVPKVSLANGLVYVYTRDESNPADLHAWYFTAIDVETGEVVFKQLTGVGWLFNNHYGSITISPDGSAYLGIMGGLVKIKDGA